MSPKAPPEIVDLFDTITGLLPQAIPFNAEIIRSVGTRYANEDDLLTGLGARRNGGRWNRPGIRAVYGSTEIETAVQESFQDFVGKGSVTINRDPTKSIV